MDPIKYLKDVSSINRKDTESVFKNAIDIYRNRRIHAGVTLALAQLNDWEQDILNELEIPLANFTEDEQLDIIAKLCHLSPACFTFHRKGSSIMVGGGHG